MNLQLRSAILLCLFFVSGCSRNIKTTAAPFSGDPYKALAETISSASARLPDGKVAIMPFSYTNSRASSAGAVVAERLLTQISALGKLSVIERGQLQKVLSELKLQTSGVMDPGTIMDFGKISGVDALITGTLTHRRDKSLEINARLIRTETAEVLIAARATVIPDWEEEAPRVMAETGPARTEIILPKPAPPPPTRKGCPPGMTGYWALDQAVNNVTPSSYGQDDAALTPGPVWTRGRIGGALRFNGRNGYAAAPLPSPPWSDWTLAAWVNPASLPQTCAFIAYVGSFENGYGFSIGTNDPLGGSGSNLIGLYQLVTWVDSGYTFPRTNAWHFVVMKREQGRVVFYVDGEPTPGSSTAMPRAPSPNISIGALSMPYGRSERYFDGMIDEVAVYDRALSAEEIRDQYRTGLKGKGYCYAKP